MQRDRGNSLRFAVALSVVFGLAGALTGCNKDLSEAPTHGSTSTLPVTSHQALVRDASDPLVVARSPPRLESQGSVKHRTDACFPEHPLEIHGRLTDPGVAAGPRSICK